MPLDELQDEIRSAAIQSARNNRPDLFSLEEGAHFGFPCSICTHRHTDLEDGPCQGCAHFTT